MAISPPRRRDAEDKKGPPRSLTVQAGFRSILGASQNFSSRCRVATAVQSETVSQQSVRIPQPATRNVAVDAYRGFVMFLMMGEVLRFSRVAQAFPGNWFWNFLALEQTHVEWA